jgi:putative intracellular protease/amidase
MNYLLFIIIAFLSSCSSLLDGSRGKILIIVSSEAELTLRDGKKYPTGYYFNELMVPVMRLQDKGFELVFANPRGNTPSMDMRSFSSKHFSRSEDYERARLLHEKLDALRSPRSLRAVVDSGLGSYDGLFIPGGHAPVIDLMIHPEMKTILNHFHNRKKPTALICHGPIVLAAATDDPQRFKEALENGDIKQALKAAKDWPYRGYQMTIFSTPEEKTAEESLGGEMVFYPEEALKLPGGKVRVGSKWQSHVVRDRELITGQNPASDEDLVQQFLLALEKTE